MKVKICGLTRVADARLAVELGADLVGLNFYPPSPRALEVDAARRIAEAVRGRALLVGVFVNRPRAEIEEIDHAVGLDLLQFHGDEEAADVEAFGRRALKVFRLAGDAAAADLAAYPRAWGFLFERRHALYGGDGRRWEYDRVAGLADDRPALLAGGLGPDNVAEAARVEGIWGLDVCSGVESAPGIKDAGLMGKLFAELRSLEAQ